MSSRAAARLRVVGFHDVYEYKPGKADWAASGLPMERARAAEPVAMDVVRRDVATCRSEEKLGAVERRTRDGGSDVCIVVNDENVVLGRLRRAIWNADPDLAVESVMENGPTTFRPDKKLADLVPRMQARKVESVLITDPHGKLIGVLHRQDAEAYLESRQTKSSGDEQQPGSAMTN